MESLSAPPVITTDRNITKGRVQATKPRTDTRSHPLLFLGSIETSHEPTHGKKLTTMKHGLK